MMPKQTRLLMGIEIINTARLIVLDRACGAKQAAFRYYLFNLKSIELYIIFVWLPPEDINIFYVICTNDHYVYFAIF